jgi:hypothetical protein
MSRDLCAGGLRQSHNGEGEVGTIAAYRAVVGDELVDDLAPSSQQNYSAKRNFWIRSLCPGQSATPSAT